MSRPPLRFAAIGLDHRHIHGQVRRLLELGCECVGYWSEGEPQPLDGFLRRYPRYSVLSAPAPASMTHAEMQSSLD